MPTRRIKNQTEPPPEAPRGPGGRRPGAGRPRDPESLLGLRRRKLALEIAGLEIDIAVKNRAKIDVEHAASVVAAAFSACRSRLLSIPPAIAPLVATLTDPEDVRRVLAEAVEEALRELSADVV